LFAIAWTIALSASAQAAPPDWARLPPESPFLAGSTPLRPELLAPGDDAGGSSSISLRYPEYRQNLEITLLAIGVATTLGAALAPTDVREVPPEGFDPDEISWEVDRRIVGQTDLGADAASDVTRNLAIAMPFVLATATLPSGGRWSGLVRRSLVYLETALISTGVTTLGKESIGRARPYAYLPESERPEEPSYDVTQDRTFRSMPSGHAATAWTAASLATTEHLLTRPHASTYERMAVGFLGGGLAGATAALRVEAGQHFPSDVVAGSAIGIATGVTVPLLHAGGEGPGRRAWLESAGGQLLGAVFGVLLATEL
jgi:membrane-associated phospholipid phosphatase